LEALLAAAGAASLEAFLAAGASLEAFLAAGASLVALLAAGAGSDPLLLDLLVSGFGRGLASDRTSIDRQNADNFYKFSLLITCLRFG
jgi:hypothetical protein